MASSVSSNDLKTGTPTVTRTRELYDNHMHTPLCKHAVGEPEEYAAVAHERGLAGITMTCHNPLPENIALGVRMEQRQFDEYVQMVQRAADAHRGRTDVRLGMECDYWPGLEPFLEHQLTTAPFSHVLGSIHPHMRVYQEMFPTRSPQEFQKMYFTHQAMAAETGLFDTISHPDLVKNNYPESWDYQEMSDHICLCLDRIAKAGTAMELNTSGLHKKITEFNPGPQMLVEMAKRNIPVVIGSDSHVPQRVAADFKDALLLMRQAGYEDASYFLDRKRVAISIDDALAALKPETKD